MNKRMLPEKHLFAYEKVDVNGKKHRGIGNKQRWVEEHNVLELKCDVMQSLAGGQVMVFYIRCEGDHDVQFTIPVTIAGGLSRHLMELGKQFSMQATNIIKPS